MSEKSKSPVVKKNKVDNKVSEMNFFDALKEVADGKKIHKLEWEDKKYFGYLKDNVLTLQKPDGKDYQWIINDGDINGTDWIVI